MAISASSQARSAQRVAQRALQNAAISEFGRYQINQIRYFQIIRPNPLATQEDDPITLSHIRQLASVSELRGDDNALLKLFRGLTAFDTQTGSFAAWAHDLAAILDMPVETVFAPTLEFHNHLNALQANVALAQNHKIGELYHATGRNITIAPVAAPFENPVELHSALHPRSDASSDNFSFRGMVVTMDEALAMLDHAINALYPHDSRKRSRAQLTLKAQFGLQDISRGDLQIGNKEIYTLDEIAKHLRVPRDVVRVIAQDTITFIRTRMVLEARADGKLRAARKLSSAATSSAQLDKTQPDKMLSDNAVITTAEFQAMLLAADYRRDPKTYLQELLDEAKLIRAEHRVAVEEQKRTGNIWNNNRTPETSQDFEYAIEHAHTLHRYVIDIVRDIESLRILSSNPARATVRRAPAPKG